MVIIIDTIQLFSVNNPRKLYTNLVKEKKKFPFISIEALFVCLFVSHLFETTSFVRFSLIKICTLWKI